MSPCLPLPTRKKNITRELGVEEEKSAFLLSRLFFFFSKKKSCTSGTLVCGTHDTPLGDWVLVQDVKYPHALSFFLSPSFVASVVFSWSIPNFRRARFSVRTCFFVALSHGPSNPFPSLSPPSPLAPSSPFRVLCRTREGDFMFHVH